MANLKNGRKFSAEFNKATEVNGQTRLLAQTPNEPVEYVDLEQVAEVVNEGMATQADLNTTNRNVATNDRNIQTLQNEVGNRYTKEQTDAQISEAINEVEQTIEEIEQTNKDTYATKTGEYKELTAGFAYEILGDGQATSEKFSFRPTGGPNRNVRDGSARIEVLKGNSVVWNQLVDADTTSVTLTANHKYITNIGGTISIQSPTSATTINVEGGVNKVTDLTQMFGAGNEPATVEQFYELLPEGVDINAYNEGEIVDANYKAIKTTGFNQWDEQWKNGTYDNNSGEFANSSFLICNINPIPICYGLNYWRNKDIGTYAMVCFWYDRNMQFLGRTEILPNHKITPIANSAFMNFRMQYEYGNTYNNDICINIAWDEYSALNGTYKPYKPFERDLSWVAKYFPATINGETKYGMRRAGNVADEIRFNSTTQQWEAVQRVGVRAYQSGDEADTAVTTDGKNTNYALATPDVKTIAEDINLAYDVADYGTEQLIVAEGAQSAPLSAEVVYEPNVLASIKQVAAMLTRIDALETAVATMQASAVATTNEE